MVKLEMTCWRSAKDILGHSLLLVSRKGLYVVLWSSREELLAGDLQGSRCHPAILNTGLIETPAQKKLFCHQQLPTYCLDVSLSWIFSELDFQLLGNYIDHCTST